MKMSHLIDGQIRLPEVHLRVFGCQGWVHILKKRRHKLEPKSQEMIFIGYEPGSKGYQFWDAAHQCIEISRDVKFNETLFVETEYWEILFRLETERST